MYQFNDNKSTIYEEIIVVYGTELVNNKAKEAIYQLQYYQIFYKAHKRINKIILILFSTIIVCLIANTSFITLNFN